MEHSLIYTFVALSSIFINEALTSIPPFIRQVNFDGYSASSHVVFTDDGYILTLFKLTSKEHEATGERKLRNEISLNRNVSKPRLLNVSHSLLDEQKNKGNHTLNRIKSVDTISSKDGPSKDASNITSDVTIFSKRKPPILLVHGLLGSAENWIVLGPHRAFAYLLVDAGFEVWLANARGTQYSRKHRKWNPDKDNEFWLFSWHEIGIFDLPAIIDYVLKAEEMEDLFYVGHSQGTTSFYVMTSERPEYNRKIRLMVAFAPVAYMGHIRAPFAAVDFFRIPIQLGIYEVLPGNDLWKLLIRVICDRELLQEACVTYILFSTGFDSDQINRSIVPVLLTQANAGASFWQIEHYIQEINSGRFQKFDFGPMWNILRYGTPVPPKYKIKHITAPTAHFYGLNDLLADVKDVRRLNKEIPNLVLDYQIPYESFNHIDFIFAKDVKTLLYDKVFETLNQHL